MIACCSEKADGTLSLLNAFQAAVVCISPQFAEREGALRHRLGMIKSPNSPSGRDKTWGAISQLEGGYSIWLAKLVFSAILSLDNKSLQVAPLGMCILVLKKWSKIAWRHAESAFGYISSICQYRNNISKPLKYPKKEQRFNVRGIIETITFGRHPIPSACLCEEPGSNVVI